MNKTALYLSSKSKYVKMLFVVMLCLLFIDTSIANENKYNAVLNIEDDTIFISATLPVSVFYNVDNNQNGIISIDEFNTHKRRIKRKIHTHLYLSNQLYKFTVKDLKITPNVVKVKNAGINTLALSGKFTMSIITKSLKLNMKLFSQNKPYSSYLITTKSNQKLLHQFTISQSSPFNSIFNDEL
ncbi:hypothetical protein [Pseudoalteromonas sp. MMG007]|uniref:hypothetical protein n=1 Tax=Pseudoalteromonas sp. MMG007 TaxID=2822684 RepID=UPI001B39B7BD|nr:hypothetical protein [Pseudoalteromonas sp. MMG007]MBQ4857290.1 hypothetical protein [Pseudoalteromonas sp. MMG007]